MEKSDYIGIDYGLGKANIDEKTGIRYGVISQNEVLQAWADSSEAEYPEPEVCETCEGTGQVDDEDCTDCEDGRVFDDMTEPLGFYLNEDGYEATQGSDGPDIFILKAPYYTLCGFCSPCAPGAGYIMDQRPRGGIRAYCFGHDFFEDGKAPYTVYDVKTECPVMPKTGL